jgi:hypothetical protein
LAGLAMLFSWQILNGSQNFFFSLIFWFWSIFFKYETINTYARAFSSLIISAVGTVKKVVGDLLEVDFGVSIVVELQNRTPKNGDIEVGFGAKQLTKGDWGKKSLERQDQMGKEWLLELVTLDDNTLNIADPGDKIEEAIFSFFCQIDVWKFLQIASKSAFTYCWKT